MKTALRYRVIKDLPEMPIGTILIRGNLGDYYVEDPTFDTDQIISPKIITNTDFFEPVNDFQIEFLPIPCSSEDLPGKINEIIAIINKVTGIINPKRML